MNATRPDGAVILEAEGTVQLVDTSARELVLLVGEVRMNLVVPPDCSICLNGERVKMRLLQSGDRAEVTYSVENGTPFAHSIRVNWLPRGSGLKGMGKRE